MKIILIKKTLPIFALILFINAISVFAITKPNKPDDFAVEKEWQFRVLLGNKEIGYHNFSLLQQNGKAIMQTEAQFDVKVLSINLYRYRHNNTEYWHNNCLTSIDAKTLENKKEFTVSGSNNKDRFVVTNNDNEQTLNKCVRSFAYWNLNALNSKNLLNSQTGEYEPINMQFTGEEFITINESQLRARRYALETNNGIISLWYEWNSKHWLALEAPARGKRTIRYQLLEMPSDLIQIQ